MGKELILWKCLDSTPGTSKHMQIITLAFPIFDLAKLFGVYGKLEAEDIVQFCEDMIKRPWPFNMVVQHTATMVDASAIRELSTKDWQEELARVKAKDWDGTPMNVKQLHMNNEKLLKAHSELDRYPYHELLKKIQEGTL